MRASPLVLSWSLLLACALTACGSSNGRPSANFARGLQTSAPLVAAEDALLAAEVKSKLVAADFETAGSIEVSVRKGIATLRGTARTEPEVARLGDAAAGVRGISSVVTLVKVDPAFRGSSGKMKDVSLAAQVSVSLAEQAGVNVLSVRTSAYDGVVTLEGKVPSGALRSVMVSAATKTRGVKKVIDKLKVLASL